MAACNFPRRAPGSPEAIEVSRKGWDKRRQGGAPLRLGMRPIPDMPQYAASEDGRIYALHVAAEPREVRARPTKDGRYLWVQLSVTRGAHNRPRGSAAPKRSRGGRKWIKVHRLVCLAFHGPPPPGKELVLHENDDGHDNRASNLRWGDGVENAADHRALWDAAWASLTAAVQEAKRRHDEEPVGWPWPYYGSAW